MAYNTPTSYNSSNGNSGRVVSPSNVSNPNSNYVTAKIYRGFSSNNPTARNGVLYDADIIKQDIYNHFMTARGERVMMPKFGSIIWDYLYEPLDETTKSISCKVTLGSCDTISLASCSMIDVVGFEHGIRLDITLLINPQNVVEQMTVEFNVNQILNNAGGTSGGGY